MGRLAIRISGILKDKKIDIWRKTSSNNKTFDTSSTLPEVLLPMISSWGQAFVYRQSG